MNFDGSSTMNTGVVGIGRFLLGFCILYYSYLFGNSWFMWGSETESLLPGLLEVVKRKLLPLIIDAIKEELQH